MKKFNSFIAMMMEMCMCACQMCMTFYAFLSDMFSISEVNAYAA